MLGEISYAWRGVTVNRGSARTATCGISSAARLAQALEGSEAAFDELLQRLGGSAVMLDQHLPAVRRGWPAGVRLRGQFAGTDKLKSRSTPLKPYRNTAVF